MPRSRSRSPMSEYTDRHSHLDNSKRSDEHRRRRRHERRRHEIETDVHRHDDGRYREKRQDPIHVGSSESANAAWDRERDRLKRDKRKAEASKIAATSAANFAALNSKELAGKSQSEIEMLRVMGFGGFYSTKNKEVAGNNVSGVHIVLKRKYRQYMNRKGGFNRPLDYVH